MSKIETLRLARNYIQLLSALLTATRTEEDPDTAGIQSDFSSIVDASEAADLLSRGISQPTSNTIRSLLGTVQQRMPLILEASPSPGRVQQLQQHNAYRLNPLMASTFGRTMDTVVLMAGQPQYLWEMTSNSSWTASEDEAPPIPGRAGPSSGHQSCQNHH